MINEDLNKGQESKAMGLVLEMSEFLSKKQLRYDTLDDRTQSRFFDEGIKEIDRKTFEKFQIDFTENTKALFNKFMNYKVPLTKESIEEMEQDL